MRLLSEQELVSFASQLSRCRDLHADVRDAIDYWRSCVIASGRALLQVYDIASAHGYALCNERGEERKKN